MHPQVLAVARGLHAYHEAVRPCARIGTRPLTVSAAWGFSLPRATAGPHCATGHPRARDDRSPRSTSKPRPTSSRRLHDGHRPASRQASAGLIPGLWLGPGFDAVYPISTRHQRFTRVRLLGPHLTRSTARLFPQRSAPPALSYRRTLRWFATPPAERPRRTTSLTAGPSISDAAPHPTPEPSTSRLLQRSWSERRHAAATARTRAPTLTDVGNASGFAASDQAAAITATAINLTCGAEVD